MTIVWIIYFKICQNITCKISIIQWAFKIMIINRDLLDKMLHLFYCQLFLVTCRALKKMEIWAGGGGGRSLSLEIRARGVLVVWVIQSGGGSKMLAIHRVCVYFFWNNPMPLYVESDSLLHCDRLGVGIFSCEEMSWKTFCVALWRKIILTLFGNHIFPSGEWRKIVTSWHLHKKKLISDPIQHIIKLGNTKCNYGQIFNIHFLHFRTQ